VYEIKPKQTKKNNIGKKSNGKKEIKIIIVITIIKLKASQKPKYSCYHIIPVIRQVNVQLHQPLRNPNIKYSTVTREN